MPVLIRTEDTRLEVFTRACGMDAEEAGKASLYICSDDESMTFTGSKVSTSIAEPGVAASMLRAYKAKKDTTIGDMVSDIKSGANPMVLNSYVNVICDYNSGLKSRSEKAGIKNCADVKVNSGEELFLESILLSPSGGDQAAMIKEFSNKMRLYGQANAEYFDTPMTIEDDNGLQIRMERLALEKEPVGDILHPYITAKEETPEEEVTINPPDKTIEYDGGKIVADPAKGEAKVCGCTGEKATALTGMAGAEEANMCTTDSCSVTIEAPEIPKPIVTEQGVLSLPASKPQLKINGKGLSFKDGVFQVVVTDKTFGELGYQIDKQGTISLKGEFNPLDFGQPMPLDTLNKQQKNYLSLMCESDAACKSAWLKKSA